jgi:hypothetical protein
MDFAVAFHSDDENDDSGHLWDADFETSILSSPSPSSRQHTKKSVVQPALVSPSSGTPTASRTSLFQQEQNEIVQRLQEEVLDLQQERDNLRRQVIRLQGAALQKQQQQQLNSRPSRDSCRNSDNNKVGEDTATNLTDDARRAGFISLAEAQPGLQQQSQPPQDNPLLIIRDLQASRDTALIRAGELAVQLAESRASQDDLREQLSLRQLEILALERDLSDSHQMTSLLNARLLQLVEENAGGAAADDGTAKANGKGRFWN